MENYDIAAAFEGQDDMKILLLAITVLCSVTGATVIIVVMVCQQYSASDCATFGLFGLMTGAMAAQGIGGVVMYAPANGHMTTAMEANFQQNIDVENVALKTREHDIMVPYSGDTIDTDAIREYARDDFDADSFLDALAG